MESLYIGTYTDRQSEGIYGVTGDPETGRWSSPALLAKTLSPTYMCWNTDRRVLYAISEEPSEIASQARGKVMSYRRDPETGALTEQSSVTAPGLAFCHLAVDSQSRYLFAVSYREASIQSYRLRPDGSIGDLVCHTVHYGKGVNPERQENAHVHSVWFSPDETRLCICDLGLDRLYWYSVDWSTGRFLYENSLAFPGASGPRHLVFHPNGHFAYVVAELSCQIFALAYTQEGFQIPQCLELLDEADPDSTAAAVRITGDGRFVYASTRGQDVLTAFRCGEDGYLTRIAQYPARTAHPRDFQLIHGDAYILCAGRDSDSLAVFQRKADGGLQYEHSIAGLSMPVCILPF